MYDITINQGINDDCCGRGGLSVTAAGCTDVTASTASTPPAVSTGGAADVERTRRAR